MTVPERLLWSRLRAGQFHALKWRRPHPIDPFIVDFYCHAASLVVELDGLTHMGDQLDRDADRTADLEARGLRVVRFTNDDVLRDLDAVLEALEQVCEQSGALPPPSPPVGRGAGLSDPPPAGRGGGTF